MTDEHPRLSTPEVCALARYGRATLWRRIDAGLMPAPIDRGGAGFLFDRAAVLKALGMKQPEPEVSPEKSWDFDPIAYREIRARKRSRSEIAGGTYRPKPATQPNPAVFPTDLPASAELTPDGKVGAAEPATMPKLGRYVVLKRRADGTHLAYFQVPARLRPPGWQAAIPLPRDGDNHVDLANTAQVGAIRSDAAILYAQLTRLNRQMHYSAHKLELQVCGAKPTTLAND